MGLSPRVRGSRYHAVRWRPTGGSIPACAGKPSWLRTLTPCVGVYPRVCGEAVRPPFEQLGQKVYPRVCGEAAVPEQPEARTKGLSPRVRGSPSDAQQYQLRVGSIPACAGKPFLSPRNVLRPTVYPRVCGEARAWSAVEVDQTGLSPRVRGSRFDTESVGSLEGSIPACAGKPPVKYLTRVRLSLVFRFFTALSTAT